MTILNFSSTHLRSVVITVCAMMIGIFPILLSSSAYASGTNAPNGRLVTIHDRGNEEVIVTHAITIGGALKDAKVSLDAKDTVEPTLDEPLVATNYSVNIYRARPVIVVDGAVRQKIVTPYQTAMKIAADAGVELHDEDTTEVLPTDIITDGAGLQLVINRATPLNLVLYGKTTTAYTREKTVAAMMKTKNITLGADDTLSVDPNTPITPGMDVEIWRNGKQTATVEEPVPFETQKIMDADQEVGYRKVQTPGETGTKNVTYEIEMKNGHELSRKVIQSVVTKQPKQQVEVDGAKQKSFGGSCGEWMAAAGITDTSSATYLINKESHCNPYSLNKSSGACGVGQALPCSKTGCAMGDGACQVKWMNSYVIGRYGSWAAAAAHSRAYGWY